MPDWRCLVSALMLVAAGATPAAAWDSPAPDVVLYCTPALDAVLHQVARRFTTTHGIDVHIFVAPPDGLLGLIRHRARDDVVVADEATLQTLAGSGQVRPDSLVALGRDPFVLIHKSGAALRNASLGDLLVAHRIVLTDPTTAASFDGAAILRAALPAATGISSVGVADTPTVVSTVRGDASLLGVVNETEAHAAGISQVALLAAAPTPISGGLVTHGQSRNAAALLAFIAGPDGRSTLGSAGLEPVS